MDAAQSSCVIRSTYSSAKYKMANSGHICQQIETNFSRAHLDH